MSKTVDQELAKKIKEFYELESRVKSLKRKYDSLKTELKEVACDRDNYLDTGEFLFVVTYVESMRFSQKTLEDEQGKKFVDAYKVPSVSTKIQCIKKGA